MLGVGLNCLEIKLDESSFFLRPSADTDKIPSDDPVICGTLILSLSRPKRISSFSVRLSYTYNLAASSPDFQFQSGQRVVSEAHFQGDATDCLYKRGKHAFLFTLVVPSSTPPSDRCAYGRVDHKLHAVAQGDSMLNAIIETSVPVFLIANPAPVDDTCKLNMIVHGFKPEVGPYVISASSQHLTVGGLINFEYKLINVPRTINVLRLSADLKTTYSTRSVIDFEKTLGSTCQTAPLFVVSTHNKEGLNKNGSTYLHAAHEDGTPVSLPARHPAANGPKWLQPQIKEPLSVVPFCGSFHFSHLTRLPDDQAIRPSTLRGTKTPIHIRHELLFKIYVTLEGGAPGEANPNEADHPYILCTSQPVTISSCCCALSSLLVPPYSERVELTEYVAKKRCRSFPRDKLQKAESTWDCVCSATEAQLVAQGLHTSAHRQFWRPESRAATPPSISKEDYASRSE